MRRQANGRLRRSREEWEGIFERFDSSEMTVAAFCHREKIAKTTFEKWKKRMGRRSKTVVAGPSFVEWPAPRHPASASTTMPSSLSAGELELSLPGGVVLRWKP